MFSTILPKVEPKGKREEEKESDEERRRRRQGRRRRRIRGTATRFKSEKEEREHVKNTENRREQVTPRSLALIRPRPSYKLRVCHRRRRKEDGRYRRVPSFFFSLLSPSRSISLSSRSHVQRVTLLGLYDFFKTSRRQHDVCP